MKKHSILLLFFCLPMFHLDCVAENGATYAIHIDERRQQHEGWGVSLCWWANMCGGWSDDKIDELVEWLVSPEGLNYNIFRYNIGGGDDPTHAHCPPHHMARGKGLRAEMEGFKDSFEDDYHWEQDSAQRKILLKIRERRPDAIFEAFSNSAPYYMTYSGCVGGAVRATDDNLRPECYEAFAHYLVDVCRHYRDAYGIEFRTLSPFNEPSTDYWYAGGSQEGCHFDFASQVAFLRVLAPILQQSGLRTVIAASDETSVATSVEGFKAYAEAGVMDLVGQWNVHTYTATNAAREELGALAHNSGVRLWMSETGLGGRGITGNLQLMQRLMDDERLLMPQAWVDWQYVEEFGDQWCTVLGNFRHQTYERVKSYYVHQQVMRFILPGYTFVCSDHANTLAAVSPKGDRLVLVAINLRHRTAVHRAAIVDATPSAGQAYVTTADTNLADFTDYHISDGLLTFSLPPKSIATFVIPLMPQP